MVIEEECFGDTNLTDEATFPTFLIKLAKTIVNQKINFPRDTKQRKWEIAIKNGQNTQIFRILRDIRDRNLLFKGNLPVD